MDFSTFLIQCNYLVSKCRIQETEGVLLASANEFLEYLICVEINMWKKYQSYHAECRWVPTVSKKMNNYIFLRETIPVLV